MFIFLACSRNILKYPLYHLSHCDFTHSSMFYYYFKVVSKAEEVESLIWLFILNFHFEFWIFKGGNISIWQKSWHYTFMKAAFVYSCEKLNYIITNITFLKSCSKYLLLCYGLDVNIIFVSFSLKYIFISLQLLQK